MASTSKHLGARDSPPIIFISLRDDANNAINAALRTTANEDDDGRRCKGQYFSAKSFVAASNVTRKMSHKNGRPKPEKFYRRKPNYYYRHVIVIVTLLVATLLNGFYSLDLSLSLTLALFGFVWHPHFFLSHACIYASNIVKTVVSLCCHFGPSLTWRCQCGLPFKMHKTTPRNSQEFTRVYELTARKRAISKIVALFLLACVLSEGSHATTQRRPNRNRL